MRARACPRCGEPRRRSFVGRAARVALAFFLVLALFAATKGGRRPTPRPPSPAPSPPSRAVSAPLRPEVEAFLRDHPEFGRPVSAAAMPDWANGPRQRAETDAGRSLLFYIRDGEVVTVYDWPAGGERRKVWGEYGE